VASTDALAATRHNVDAAIRLVPALPDLFASWADQVAWRSLRLAQEASRVRCTSAKQKAASRPGTWTHFMEPRNRERPEHFANYAHEPDGTSG
jgi:hypothetical protein